MRSRSRAPRILLAAFVVLGVLGLGGGLAFRRLCTQPLDVSGTGKVPGWAAEVKNRDGLAYPAHAVLGSALERLSCQPEAVALQWLKAAAHARTGADVEESARGLAAVKERSADERDLKGFLCRNAQHLKAEQLAALAGAGVVCDDNR